MEDHKKSFVMDISTSIKSQLTTDLWKEFESIAVSNKIPFVVQNTSVLRTIDDRLSAELLKHHEKNESCDDIMAGYDFRKSAVKAKVFKAAGNEAFGRGDNDKALEMYSIAIAFMEINNKTDLSILYANRSAALFHLGYYVEAQGDIDSAFELGYPQELQYKLYDRSGRCYVKQNKNPEASRRFQQAINALTFDGVTLDEEKKKGVKASVHKMLKISGARFGFICSSTNDSNKKCETELPKTSGGKGPYLRNASGKLTLMQNPDQGRYIVATENISPGEIIVVEKAYVSVLTQEAYHYQCFNCFKMLLAPIPCSNCALVSFCSIHCFKLAWASHHQFECDILGILRLAGVSITCLMALRVLTQSPFPDIMKWKCEESDVDEEKGDERPKAGGNWKDFRFQFKDAYRPDHISSVFKLVTHADARTSDDYFQRVVMVLFLYKILTRTTYFHRGVGPETLEDKLASENGSFTGSDSGTIIHVGSILLRLLQTLQFNAHEIASWDLVGSKSCFIGGGLFPTLAFFNHSCNPAIVRYFINDTVVVRTVRTIQRGEPVTENYGPVFTQWKLEARQNYLRQRYWFSCSCVACTDDWPLFENMSRDLLNFRCRNCRSFLCQSTSDSFHLMLRCARCLKPTNMLQSLKLLEKSEGKYKEAMEFLDKGKTSTAQGILVENLALFDSILLPPFQDYHSCQEGLRKCFLPMGNQSKSLKIKRNEQLGSGCWVKS